MTESRACEEKLQEGLRAADRALAYHHERLRPLLERLSSLPPSSDGEEDDDLAPPSALPAACSAAGG